ncbi:MAG: glycosyltransferase [Bauldia sp.]|nr:glycosyltransferase [Bauldia sp.]
MNPEPGGSRLAAPSRPSRLTIAICTRNRAASLRRTLVSLAGLAPPAAPWEVVVVLNDCSDDSAVVVEEFAGSLPLVVGTEPRAGLSPARNRAVELATGELIVWTDDDVLLAPGWLRAYEAAATAHPEASFFGGPITPLFEGTPPPWLLPALPVIGSAYARQLVETDGAPVRPDRLPYGANFAVRAGVQRRHPFDLALGQAPIGWLRGGEETAVLGAILAEGGSGVWVKDAGLDHVIPPERQTLDYLARYYEGFGRLTARPAKTPLARFAVWGDHKVAEWRLRAARASGDPARWLLALQRAAIRRGRLAAIRPPAASRDRRMIPVKLIVAADEPALFFASVQDAERDLEPIDVQDGVYGRAFGPNGEPYAISTDGTRVHIETTGAPPQPEALKALLLHYFDARGETPDPSLELPALLQRCSPSDR